MAPTSCRAYSSSPPEQKIGDIYCDLNGERHRSEEFTFAMLRNPTAI